MKIFKLISSGFSVLRIGNEFRNPAAWKNAQTISSFLFAVLGVLAACDINIEVLPNDVMGAAVIIAGLANAVITVGSSKKIGIGSRTQEGTVEPGAQPDSTSQAELPPIELVGTASWYNDKTPDSLNSDGLRVPTRSEPIQPTTRNQEPQTPGFGDKY